MCLGSYLYLVSKNAVFQLREIAECSTKRQEYFLKTELKHKGKGTGGEVSRLGAQSRPCLPYLSSQVSSRDQLEVRVFCPVTADTSQSVSVPSLARSLPGNTQGPYLRGSIHIMVITGYSHFLTNGSERS